MNQQIDQLFEKYLNGACSPAEWQELLTFISHIEENDTDTLSAPMLTLWEKARNKELPSTASLLEREKIYRTATQEESATTASSLTSSPSEISTEEAGVPVVHRVHFLKTSWFRYAAAVVLIAGGAIAYVISSDSEKSQSLANDNKHLKTDIAPGSEKAVLTLADGTKIVLDNAANGNVAEQGSTKIIKLDNGQLAYSPLQRQPGDAKVGSGARGGLLAGAVLYNTISTPRGGQYQITLPDGTKVWLNAASSIKFPTVFSGSTREVEMTGEAYMEIARNSKQPFRVKANGTEIQVLGTSFNINAYSDEEAVKTTLVDGSVRVLKDGKSAILKPSEQAIAGNLDNSPIQKITVQTDDILAWKNGYFQFDNASVLAVMRQIGRWYDLEIHYAGTVPDRLFKGKLQRSLPLSRILSLLEKGDIHLKLQGKSLTVLP
jgi:ferric-dicitrate binding protein FerR (iron transport regulator)